MSAFSQYIYFSCHIACIGTQHIFCNSITVTSIGSADVSCDVGLACPDNPDHMCGHSSVDSLVTIQKGIKSSYSTECVSNLTLKKYDRIPKPYYQISNLNIGNYRCIGSRNDNGATEETGYKCKRVIGLNEDEFHEDTPMPPVNITVDYGDGSPLRLWTMENPSYVWGYEYSYGGTYEIKIQGMI